VLQLLAENTPEPAKSHFGSFYSSALGGIVTEPGFMLVSIDDAMVNKGDAVYESVSLSEGYLYKLDARMARFLDSADLAGIPLPFSEERLRRVLLDTAATSLKMNGERRALQLCCGGATVSCCVETPPYHSPSGSSSHSIHQSRAARVSETNTSATLCDLPAGMLTFWLSRGRGGLGLGQSNGSTFYALLSTGELTAPLLPDARAVCRPYLSCCNRPAATAEDAAGAMHTTSFSPI
jgi:hypothetical protein